MATLTITAYIYNWVDPEDHELGTELDTSSKVYLYLNTYPAVDWAYTGLQVGSGKTEVVSGVPHGEVVSITGRVCTSDGCLVNETGFKLFSKTTTLIPDENKALTLTINPSTIPTGGITEVIYEEFTFDGRRYQGDSWELNPGANLSFLWGVGDYIYNEDHDEINATVGVEVELTLTDWDGVTVLWEQTKELNNIEMSYLDNIDVGPITFNLPATLTGKLEGNISWSGISPGERGVFRKLNLLVGQDPTPPTPPQRVGTGLAEEFATSFGGEPNAVFLYPYDNFSAGCTINRHIKQGDPDAEISTSFYAILIAKDMEDNVYWYDFVQSPYHRIPEGGSRRFGVSTQLPKLYPGTLSITYGGDTINRWSEFLGHPIQPCKNLVKNAGFEIEEYSQNKAAYWTGGDYRSTTDSKEGVACASAVISTGGMAWLTQSIAVEPNTQYRLGGWVKVEPGYEGNTYLDLNDIPEDVQPGIFVSDESMRDNVWHWVEKTTTTGPTTTRVTLRVVGGGPVGNTKRLTWDNILLMPVVGTEGVWCDPLINPEYEGGFPEGVQDTQTLDYTVIAPKSEITSTTTPEALIPGEHFSVNMVMTNKGNMSAYLGGQALVYDSENNIILDGIIGSDSNIKNPGETSGLTFQLQLPADYNQQYIRVKVKAYHIY